MWRDVIGKVQKQFWLDANKKCWTNDVLDVAKLLNILLDKQSQLLDQQYFVVWPGPKICETKMFHLFSLSWNIIFRFFHLHILSAFLSAFALFWKYHQFYFSLLICRENIALRSQLEQMRRFIQEREQKYVEIGSLNETLTAEVR